MKKYLFAVLVAFFFSGCSDTDEIVRKANQRSQAEIDRLVAINKRQEQELEQIEHEKNRYLEKNKELRNDIYYFNNVIDTIKKFENILKQQIKLLEIKKNLSDKDAILNEINKKIDFLKWCVEKRQQLKIGDNFDELDNIENEIEQCELQLKNKTYGIKFNPPEYCILAYTIENIKTNKISIKYITKQNISDYAVLRSKMIGDIYEDEKQILNIACICAMGLYFLRDTEDDTIWSYLVSGVSEPKLGMITPGTPVAIKLREMEEYDTIEISMLNKQYQLVDKILQDT